MTVRNITHYASKSGRLIKEDGSLVNEGDSYEKQGDKVVQNVQIVGTYTGLSADEKPIEGVKNGSSFVEVDTKRVFVFHNGDWWDFT